ncbi:ead/Ea22-like family protein [Escherichia coli]|uniref:ead/Ea22-like family protein n=1 Tax=Escherichia coli TaxID=562 RepID=UPI0017D23CA2|nr:ead/Ea22-like family protein [Escherichia coli]EIK0414756.1 ead/Ea22-like family protein [Escherichia coli]MCN3350593.1 ead/Ea22-like family protein [Escherichia coli]MCN5432946.1 ead/Ea22-like family protein [Escherichia coli]QRQ00603.1 ead/Ea22-like family protein [Escherichia coli]HAJ5261938.1 ead/Ea22-like family protein [Escherichia coli]
MSNIDKRALREAAVRAGGVKWQYMRATQHSKAYITDDKGSTVVNCSDGDVPAKCAGFIAAANPATVLALLDELDVKDQRIADLECENAYIRNRHKELDLLIGKNILVMQAAIIEWQGTGDARKGLAWIYNTLFGPVELPDESEKDAQAYFDRKYAPLDEELINLHRWFWEQSEAERAAEAAKGE